MAGGAEPEEKLKKFAGPVTVERSFKVDGKKLTVLLTFPGQVADEFGMETVMAAANRAILTVDSKNHKVEPFR